MSHGWTGRARSADRDTTLRITEVLGAVAQLVSSVEHLIDADNRLPGGVNDPELLRSRFAASPPRVRWFLERSGSPRVVRTVHVLRTVAATSLLLPLPRAARVAASAGLAGSQLVQHPHHQIGADGSDHASFLVQVVVTIARAGGGRTRLVDACLWYLAAQSSFNYGVSGWTKLAGPGWRSGTALPGILRTQTYGDERAYRLLKRHPVAGHALGGAVLALECLFPVVLVGRTRSLAPVFVASAAAFHLANARLMGLNRFLPAFVAMHPSVLYAAVPRELTATLRTGRRDDTMPAVIGLVGLVGLVTAALANARRRRLVLRGRAGDRTATMATGHVLRYHRTDPDKATGGDLAPLIVCSSGLASSAEHWEWVARDLQADHPVVTYHRAGYGGSRAARDDRPLDAAVDDLVALALGQSGGRPLVLMGHSLGGYLAWRAAARLGDRVLAVVMVDSSHPDELKERDASAQEGIDALDRAMTANARWMRAGFGFLADTPAWLRAAPGEVRGLIDAQLRDPGTWSTARREWRDLRRAFAVDELERLDVPALVLTTAKTADTPEQLALHHAMVSRGGAGSRHELVPHSRHDSVLLAARSAAAVAALTRQLLGTVSAAPSDRLDAGDARLAGSDR